MRTVLIILLVGFYSIAYGQKASKQTGWIFYWGGAVVWFSSDRITNRAKRDCFFANESKYTNGLKVGYIPDALFYKSIAKGYKISDVTLNGSPNINNKPIADDSVWVVPARVFYQANPMPISGLSPIDTLSFSRGENKTTVVFSFEADYVVVHIELLRKKDKRRLKRVKNYTVYPPH